MLTGTILAQNAAADAASASDAGHVARAFRGFCPSRLRVARQTPPCGPRQRRETVVTPRGPVADGVPRTERHSLAPRRDPGAARHAGEGIGLPMMVVSRIPTRSCR
jgi:hypothetical protein